MPTDLYACVRKIKRRMQLDPHDFHKWELTELARDLVLCRPDREELLAIAVRMLEVERQLPNRQIAFARQMQQAIEADDYVINRPVARPPEPDIAEGHLYIATAWSRPGLAKLGATFRDPRERVAEFAERYGYPVTLSWSAYLRRPFSLEARLRQELSGRQAPARAYGDSVGWYRMTAEELHPIIQQEVGRR